MSNPDIRLAPRQQVKGAADSAFSGRLGLLVLDGDNSDLLAVTAAQVARGADLLSIDNTSVLVAEAADPVPPATNDTVLPVEAMLRTFRVDENFKLSDEQIDDIDGGRAASGGIVKQPYEQLGRRVLIQTGEEKPRVAQLKSVSGRFRMPAPETRKMTTFTDALEVVSLNGQPLTRKGDSGALVTTLAGDALGIIVCGIGSASFAAPLVSVLSRKKNILPLTDERIKSYNREIDERLARDERPRAAEPASAKMTVTPEALLSTADNDDTNLPDSFFQSVSEEYFG